MEQGAQKSPFLRHYLMGCLLPKVVMFTLHFS